jgi:hypothetical protein
MAAIGLVAGTLLAPLTAQAAPRRITCNDAGCHEDCQQQLPNGDTAYYTHGTVITLYDGKTGEEIKFKCVDGQWVKQAGLQLPQFWKGLQILGNIGVGSLAGFKGDVTSTQCNDSPEPVCTDVSYTVGPPGLTLSDGGCNPNQVFCP